MTEVDGHHGKLRPALALRWTPNDNATEWTFQLDPDRITAGEVIQNFERKRNSESKVTSATLEIVDSVDAPTSDTVRFRLDSSSAGFPWLLAGPTMAVVSDKGRTGRSTVSEDTSGLLLEAEADRPETKLIWASSATAAAYKVERGTADLAITSTATDSESLSTGVSVFVGFNLRSELVADLDTRQTLAAAMNASPAESDRTLPISSASSPALVGSQAQYCGGKWCGAEPNADALEELEGEQVVVGVTSGRRRDAEKLGFSAEIADVDLIVKSYSPSKLADAIVNGEVDMFIFGWTPVGASLDATVPMLFHSSSPAQSFGLEDSAVDELIDEAQQTVDDESRWELLSAAERRAVDQVVVVPLWANRSDVVRGITEPEVVVRGDGSLETTRLE